VASYKRQCRKCRQWIQLRQMPGGQWVAFEGYDTVHRCSSTRQKGRLPIEATGTDDATTPVSADTNSTSRHSFAKWFWIVVVVLVLVYLASR